jgi:hypothetical protein
VREEKCEVEGKGKREKRKRKEVLKAATLFISQSFLTFLVSVLVLARGDWTGPIQCSCLFPVNYLLDLCFDPAAVCMELIQGIRGCGVWLQIRVAFSVIDWTGILQVCRCKIIFKLMLSRMILFRLSMKMLIKRVGE